MMDVLKDNPIRLDLRGEGEIVLIQNSNHWVPFKVTRIDTFNRRVFGILLLKNKEVVRSGGTPTHIMNYYWRSKYIEQLENEFDELKSMIKTLNNLDIP